MKIKNKLNLPQPLVDAVTREYTPTPNRYSVTTLLKGTKEIILSRRYGGEIEKDVSEMIWLILGNAVHGILENANEAEDELKETFIEYTFKDLGMTISGKQDLYSESSKTITDYKTASVNKVLFNDWDDYRKQTLMYCYIFRKLGFDAENGQIVAILKDWATTKAKREHDYPKLPIHIEKWHFTEQEFEDIENFIKDKLMDIKAKENLPDNLIPECTPEERWHKDDTYAVMKKGNKRAVRVFNNIDDAKAFIDEKLNADQKEGLKLSIEKRNGEDVKCCNYCDYCKYCSYYKSRYAESGDD